MSMSARLCCFVAAMLLLAADENFNSNIVRGLLRRQPALDLVRLQDAGLSGAEDPLYPSFP